MKYWVAIFNGRLKPALTRAARVAIVAAWISLTIFAVAEATAKSADTNTEFNINVNLCEHAVDDPQVRIVACTFVLNSGNIPEKEIPRVYYYRANRFTKVGQLDQALQDLNRLINLDPTRAEAFYNRGRIYYFKHQYGRAIQNFDRAIAIFSSLDLTYRNHGTPLVSKEKLQLVISSFALMYRNRGQAHHKKEQYQHALRDLDQAIRINPKDAGAYNARGAVYDELKQYSKAIQDFDRAIALAPDNAIYYFNRGHIDAVTGKFNRAINYFGEAIERDPKFASAYSDRGMAYSHSGQHTRALGDFDQAVRFEPGRADVYRDRAFVLNAVGRIEQAIESLGEYIQRKPNSPDIYLRRARIQLRRDRYREAARDFETAIEIDNSFYWAISDLAWILATAPDAGQRNGTRAVKLARQAVKIKDISHNRAVLAAALAATGQFEEAVSEQQRALEMLESAGGADDADELRTRMRTYKINKPHRLKPGYYGPITGWTKP